MEIIIDLFEDPLILLMTILFLGSWLGQISIKGLSLGASGVLFVGMIFGHFGYEISPIVQNLGLSLFIVSVGLQAGPRFFRILRTKGLIFGLLAFIVVIVAVVTTFIVSKVLNLSKALSIGIMTGALTSTPGLAAALQATNDPLATVGYGIAYPFGLLTVVLFIQFIPKILRVDLKEDAKKSKQTITAKNPVHLMTIEITNPNLHKKTIKDLNITKNHSIVISRLIRNKRMIMATGDVVLLQGDQLVTVGSKEDLNSFCEYVGKKVDTNLQNKDNIDVRKIVVDAYDIIGKSLQELGLRKDYGITVTRIERNGIELNINPKMRLARGDVLTIVSSEDRLNQVEKLFTKKDLTVTNVHVFSLSLILLIGILVGRIPIYLPGLGTITLGVAGGPLFIALIISHFGNFGPIHARYYTPANQVIRDLGLVLFLAGVGTTSGQGIVEVIQTEGLRLVLAAIVIAIIPMIAGIYFARKIFKFSMVLSLGSLSGAMTSTPGLGVVNQLSDNEEPAIAYAATYPFALIFVAIAAQLVPLLL